MKQKKLKHPFIFWLPTKTYVEPKKIYFKIELKNNGGLLNTKKSSF
jgi:hypothetical protein